MNKDFFVIQEFSFTVQDWGNITIFPFGKCLQAPSRGLSTVKGKAKPAPSRALVARDARTMEYEYEFCSISPGPSPHVSWSIHSFPWMVFEISVSPTKDQIKVLVVCAIQTEACTYTVTTRAGHKISKKWYTRASNSRFTFVKQVHREASAQKVDCKKTACWSCSYHCHLLLQPHPPPSRFRH